MARIDSLNILLTTTGKDYLAELYGQVIENVEKGTISGLIKNRNLSGDPEAGSVEAKRFEFAKSSAYGTARAARAGTAVKALPVTVQINVDREIIEEIEQKDTKLYGVDGLLSRRSAEHQLAMIRELESAFFAEAAGAAAIVTPVATDPLDIFEELVLSIETVKNDFVNGVPRNMIHVILAPSEYSKLRNKINTGVNNANVSSAVEEFGTLNGVNVYSSIDLPTGITRMAMATQSVAQPVMADPYDANRIPLTNAYSVELFYHYGTKAVMPDLISVTGTLATLTVASAAGGETGKTAVTVTPAPSYGQAAKYKTGASITLPTFGATLDGTWAAFTSGGDYTATTGHDFAVAYVGSDGKVSGAGKATVVAAE